MPQDKYDEEEPPFPNWYEQDLFDDPYDEEELVEETKPWQCGICHVWTLNWIPATTPSEMDLCENCYKASGKPDRKNWMLPLDRLARERGEYPGPIMPMPPTDSE